MNYLIGALVVVVLATLATFVIHKNGDVDVTTPTTENVVSTAGKEGVDETVSPDEDAVERESIPPVSGRVLDMSNMRLSKVPSSVFEEVDVVSLDISGNNLDGALQAEIRHMKKLKTLDMSDNNFTGVPAEIGQLSALEVLDLSNNPITGLPYELGNLKNLKVLDLRGTSYAPADLEVIKKGLPSTVTIKVD